MLTPSAPGAAPHGLGSTGEPTFNRLWTLLGTAVRQRAGTCRSGGLPLGVQVVGRFGRDRFALAAARFRGESDRASAIDNLGAARYIPYYMQVLHT